MARSMASFVGVGKPAEIGSVEEIEVRRVFMGASLAQGGDAIRLDQIVTNLLGNAVKYTPSHGRIEIFFRSYATATRPC
jgi:signal transduction histidine kinase